MNVFGTKKKSTSVHIAKDRLKALLVSDRVNCTPDIYEKIQEELYRTVSKYIDVLPEQFDTKITQSYIHITLTGENS